MNSAIRKPGSASTTPRRGSRIRRRTCWSRRRCCRPRTFVIGPGGFLLPYHHPAELANRVAMLDHLSGGRLNFGVAASGLPSDWAMFNVDGMSGQNRDMTREALEIILKMWTEDAPWTYKGKFWTVNQARHDVRLPQAPPQAAAGAASADRRRRPEQELRHAEARRRARLHSDEPQPQPGLCRKPLGLGRDGCGEDRTQAEAGRIGGWCARCSSPIPTRRPGSSRPAT